MCCENNILKPIKSPVIPLAKLASSFLVFSFKSKSKSSNGMFLSKLTPNLANVIATPSLPKNNPDPILVLL